MRALPALLTALTLLACGPAVAAPPQVVASIKPLHSLVAGVTEGVSEPDLLLSAGDSPHTYAMRPSEARAVRNADLVVHISPHMEAFLERALDARGDPDTVLAAADIEGIELLGGRDGDTWGEDGHRHGDDDAHRRDYHLWLDPQNAQIITAAVAERLAALDPRHADTYRENAEAQKQRLAALEADLDERLEPVRGLPYVVFHDAYQYFEQRFGLKAVGAVTVNPEQPPGARHLNELRGQIRELDTVCVFSEPQFEPAIARALVRGLDARAGELDPLGAGLEPGPDAYFQLLERLADGFVDCLVRDEQPGGRGR
ncbi:zinc ABC transporter substrate-binding protein [Halorhodospira halophila]|uniref:High-affinity zinc uptake system protein ZnuA n=1 Tax=Halorhodospira halophila (strain DSM 244 / SL1) TaxID=349124 RepID=A1WXT2_HALHL|nr:zinc ABC transporter substrate-binding protein [Halorhodospira halophila]ABM62494.1 periplasmic solute binding protein [Halorhodospira halophila SL1]MBK1728172.1 zinc ABC transporter substrate-binding protein [Halorhodospira halophila]